MIFELASARDTKPKKVLRYWFEKKEVKEIIAKHDADHPNGPAPRVVYNDEREEEESEDEVEPDHQDDQLEDEDEDDNEDDDNDDDDEDHDEDENDNEEEQDDEAADQDDGDGDEQLHVHDQETGQGEAEIDEEMSDPDNIEAATAAAIASESEQAGAATISSEVVEAVTIENNAATATADQAEPDEEMSNSPAVEPQVEPANVAGGENEDEQMQDGEQAGAEDEDDEDEDEGEDAEDQAVEGEGDGMVDQNDIAIAAAAAHTTPPPPPAPIVAPHQKWRHIPKFVRMTQCPPPVELFLICKQLNEEAKDWFYNVAVLKIDATASFSHFSFFEVALGQIADAAFSPMENIRKTEVTFVWDTTWIRAESTGYAASVFSFFLQSRADYVLKILQQAPDLDHVVIHWHDTAEDEEAQGLMQDILEKFVCNLQATIDTRPHIIASDSKPHFKSIAGKRRLEFQSIVDNPPDAF
jgi:hypothetical protein